jgi:hypothetical protein
MDYKINKFNVSSNSWIYRICDLLVTDLDIDIDDGSLIDELENAKYSAAEVPELSHYLIHFDRDGSMISGKQIEHLMMQLKDRVDATEIIQELARVGKLRTDRQEKRKAELLAASTAERKAEMNDPEWQKEMWKNDLELQLWDENSDLSSEQRSVYERQLSGLR